MKSVLFTVLITLTSNYCGLLAQVPEFLDTIHLSSFGADFKWGTACAAYQIDGAWNIDGKGISIWDEFAHTKGKIHNDENGDVAVDFHHRYKDDIRLHKEMNFDVFRFSISWTRIFPDGTGEVSPQGVQFYHDVIDECLGHGVEPWITLYHWDLPQKLQDQGGWTNRKMIEWFADYTKFCAEEYGDKVKNWMVMRK